LVDSSSIRPSGARKWKRYSEGSPLENTSNYGHGVDLEGN
jgi:hypothetical protein